MGEALRKAKVASIEVPVDFSAPELVISRGDGERLRSDLERWGSEADDSAVRVAAVRMAMRVSVNAAFPQGMARGKDTDAWEAWLECIDDDATGPVYRLSMGHVEWLRKRLEDENAKIPASFVQWRGAVLDYLVKIQPEEPPEAE